MVGMLSLLETYGGIGNIMAQKIDSDFPMPWGKHKGMKICDLPTNYINWWLENTNPNTEFAKKIILEMENQLRLRKGEGIVR